MSNTNNKQDKTINTVFNEREIYIASIVLTLLTVSICTITILDFIKQN
jgi:hypothetical protein